jgi:hypothetical protein
MEVVMDPSPRRLPRLAALAPFAPFALSAAIAFALVRPGAPEAGAGGGPPLAVSGPVQLYGELTRDGQGLAVHVRAVNGGAEAQHCRVTATVSEWRDSPMSRVVRAPRRLWSAALVVAVRGGEAAEERVAVPADVAGRLAPAPAGAAGTGAAPEQQQPRSREAITHGVLLEASCLAGKALG